MKTLNGREILAVRVPKDARSIEVYNEEDNWIQWYSFIAVLSVRSLPTGSWSILGRKEEVTEEVARGLVEFWGYRESEGDKITNIQTCYENYEKLDDPWGYSTALESFLSWCKANDITDEVLLIKNK